MPSFLIPVHESNDCHNPPGSPEGGQFCSRTTYGQKGGEGATKGKKATTYEATLPDGTKITKRGFIATGDEAWIAYYYDRDGKVRASAVRAKPEQWGNQQWVKATRVEKKPDYGVRHFPGKLGGGYHSTRAGGEAGIRQKLKDGWILQSYQKPWAKGDLEHPSNYRGWVLLPPKGLDAPQIIVKRDVAARLYDKIVAHKVGDPHGPTRWTRHWTFKT